MAGANQERLEKRLESVKRRFTGTVSIAAKNIATGEEILVNPDQTYPTASVFKIPVMIEVYRQAEQGSVALDQRIPLTTSNIVRGSGVLRDLQAGLQPTISDLVVLMIVVSDNTATNMLIDYAGGVTQINETMRSLGFDATTINHHIDFDYIGKDNRRLAVSSPRDLMGMCAALVGGELISPTASSSMLDVLGRQHYLNQVPRYFAYNPYGPELGEPQSLWIGCKTGALPGMRADAGVIRLPDERAIAYAVMNEGSEDTGFGFENESEIVNGLIGRALLEYWWPENSGKSLPAVNSPYLSEWTGDMV